MLRDIIIKCYKYDHKWAYFDLFWSDTSQVYDCYHEHWSHLPEIHMYNSICMYWILPVSLKWLDILIFAKFVCLLVFKCIWPYVCTPPISTSLITSSYTYIPFHPHHPMIIFPYLVVGTRKWNTWCEYYC